MLDVLTRFRSSEVDKAVKSLNSDEVDVLMKYIYRGFAYPTENSCGILLVWHEKVHSVPKGTHIQCTYTPSVLTSQQLVSNTRTQC